MARSNPGHRRRPGRRPPYRPSAGGLASGPRPQGFTGPGMRQLVDAVLPMQGKERKQFYNQASTGLVVGLGLGGALLGGSWAGPVGALFGLGVGATLGGAFVERWRFYRQ
jgi:hypothetical protein